MKIKGWVLTVVCGMLWIVLCGAVAFIVLSGQPMFANLQLWWWVLINFCILILLFGYGLKRGIQMLRMFRIPESKLTRRLGVVVCDYDISLKQYAYFKLWDWHHFSFSLLFVIYVCVSLCSSQYIVSEEQNFFSPLLILFLFLVYVLIMLLIRLNKIYKKSIAGPTWVEISPEGLTIDRAQAKRAFRWDEINGIAIYKDYCFLYTENGHEALLVTSDEKVKEAVLYYLNEKNNQKKG